MNGIGSRLTDDEEYFANTGSLSPSPTLDQEIVQTATSILGKREDVLTELKRLSPGKRLKVVNESQKNKYFPYELAFYLKPLHLIHHVTHSNQLTEEMDPCVRGLIISESMEPDSIDEMLKLPKVLERVRDIYIVDLNNFISVMPQLLDGCHCLERLIISKSVFHGTLLFLKDIRTDIAIRLESMTIITDGKLKWKDLGIRPDLQVEFKNVSVVQRNNKPVPLDEYLADT